MPIFAWVDGVPFLTYGNHISQRNNILCFYSACSCINKLVVKCFFNDEDVNLMSI